MFERRKRKPRPGPMHQTMPPDGEIVCIAFGRGRAILEPGIRRTTDTSKCTCRSCWAVLASKPQLVNAIRSWRAPTLPFEHTDPAGEPHGR